MTLFVVLIVASSVCVVASGIIAVLTTILVTRNN